MYSPFKYIHDFVNTRGREGGPGVSAMGVRKSDKKKKTVVKMISRVNTINGVKLRLNFARSAYSRVFFLARWGISYE